MNALLYNSENRQATWLELFFDLVFVAAIGVITHDLAHAHDGHLSTEQVLRFPLVFIPLWWIWVTHTMLLNRFDIYSQSQKLLTLFIMGMIIFMSSFFKESLSSDFKPFVLLYFAIRVIMSTWYFFTFKEVKEEATFTRDLGLAILVGAFVSGSAYFIESNLKFFAFYAGIAVDMIYQATLRHKTSKYPVDKKHLVERTGLLAVIILGETVISIVGSLALHGIDKNAFSAISGFVLLGAIWWVYFGSLHRLEKAKNMLTGTVLVYSHLFFYIGLILLANLVQHSILGTVDTTTFGTIAIVGLTLFYMGKQISYIAAFPPYRFGIVVNTIICIVITTLSTLLPKVEYSIIGMTLGILIYVLLNVKWLIPKYNVDKYLEE